MTEVGAAAVEVLEWVNRTHGLSLTPKAQLAGGYQNGALLLRGLDGGPAVLKFTVDADWAVVIERAAPVVSSLRAVGWPTPAWLFSGRTDRGWGYVVQEFVSGEVQELTSAWVDLVLPLVDSHAGLAPPQARSWSVFDRSVVFEDGAGYASAVSASVPAAVDFVRRATTFVAAFAEVALPDDDLVHGDLNPGNVLVRDGALAAVVDVEALGSGSRLHDLATVASYAWLWGDRTQTERVLDHARVFAEPGQLEISVVAVLLGLFAFGVRNWPADDLTAAAGRGTELLEVLSRSRPRRASGGGRSESR